MFVKPRLVAAATASDAAAKLFLSVNMLVSFALLFGLSCGLVACLIAGLIAAVVVMVVSAAIRHDDTTTQGAAEEYCERG